MNVPTKMRPSRIVGAVTVNPGSGSRPVREPVAVSTAASPGVPERANHSVPPAIVGEPFSDSVPSACDQTRSAEQSAPMSTRTRCAPVTTNTALRAAS